MGREFLSVAMISLFVLLMPFKSTAASSGTEGKWIFVPFKAEIKELKSLQGHRKGADSVAISPDGRLVASGGRDGTILIHDAATGEQLKSFRAHRKVVHALAFSPDGSLLASGGRGSKAIFLWDTKTWERVKVLKGHRHIVYSVAFSPDGNTLASGSHDKLVMLWDVKAGKRKKYLKGHRHGVSSVAFSPDGRTLVSGGLDARVKLWDMESGKAIRTLIGGVYPVKVVAFSPDGKTLASAGKGKKILLWDAESGTRLREIPVQAKAINALAFSRDGNLLFSGGDDVAVWKVSDGGIWKSLPVFSPVFSLALSRDGAVLVSAGRDVRLWDFSGYHLTQEFKKSEFETMEEYHERMMGKYLPYSSPVTLGKYDILKRGFKAKLGTHDIFIRIPRDIAPQFKENSRFLMVEGSLVYFESGIGELINAYLVDTETGQRVAFGRHTGDVSAPDSPAGQIVQRTPSEKGAPELAYDVALEDGNGDGILNGGERVSLRVTVKNSGKGTADGVVVNLEGEPTLVGVLGGSRTLGSVPPGGERTAVFETVLPNELNAGNVKLEVSVKESRGYSPMEIQALAVAMKPAMIRVSRTVLSSITDVDIIPERPRGHKCEDCYALLVGISNYRNPDAVPPVKYASKDAETMSRYLETVGGVPRRNIKLLTDGSATRADIESSLEEWLPRRVSKGSTVYVYYAGHGTPDPSTNQAYIVPYEGEAGYIRKLYPLKNMYAALDRLPASQVYVMLDSCFSGSGERSIIPKGARPMTLSVENPLLAGDKVVVLAASKGNEISSDYERAGHGLFTYYLLKGLKGDADSDGNGTIGMGELYEYVREGVADTAVAELDREQNPVLLPGIERIRGREMPVARVK